MAFNTPMDEMIDFYKSNMKRSYDHYLSVQQQIQNLGSFLLPGMNAFETEPAKRLFQDLTASFDNMLNTLQSLHTDMFDKMKPDTVFKKNIEDIWDQLGVARLDETRMLGQQLERLKIKLSEYQNQDRTDEIESKLESNGKLALKEDLKPFEAAFADLRSALDSIGDVEALRLKLTQVEKDLSRYMSEVAQIKGLAAQINSDIAKLTTAVDGLSEQIGKVAPPAGE